MMNTLSYPLSNKTPASTGGQFAHFLLIALGLPILLAELLAASVVCFNA